MKKILILIAFIVSGGSLMAQNIKFGLKTGINFPSLQSQSPFSQNGKFKVSAKFLFGAYADIKIGKLTFQPGIIYSVKGDKSVQDTSSISYGAPVAYTIERNLNLGYLEIPLNLLYNHSTKIGTLYVGGGPYAAFGLTGRMRSINKRNTYLKKGSAEKIEFGNQVDQIKRNDFGINLTGGLKINNKIDLGLNYGFGLSNISNDSAIKSHNRLLGLQVGYLF